jgi:hypothetical protein
MDLLVIPVLLLIGGTLIYIGANGMPDLTLSALPLRRNRQPFEVTEWLRTRPSSTKARRSADKLSSGEHDAELVELMNEMIAVREDLTALKQRMAGKAPRRTEPVIHAGVAEPDEAAEAVPVVEEAPAAEKLASMAEEPVKPVIAASSKLPHPVKTASQLPPELLKQKPLPAAAAEANDEKPALTLSASIERSRAEKPVRHAESPVEPPKEDAQTAVVASHEAKVAKPEASKPAPKQESREKTSQRRPSFHGHTRRYARI